MRAGVGLRRVLEWMRVKLRILSPTSLPHAQSLPVAVLAPNRLKLGGTFHDHLARWCGLVARIRHPTTPIFRGSGCRHIDLAASGSQNHH